MPSHLNGSHVWPVIKTSSVDKDVLDNYRPVSICHICLRQQNVLLLRQCRLTCPSITSATATSLCTRQITASRWPLSVYRMRYCVQWTIRTLSSWCFWTCRLHSILLITILKTNLLPGSLIFCCVAISVILWMENILT